MDFVHHSAAEQVLDREHRAEEARRKEKSFLTSAALSNSFACPRRSCLLYLLNGIFHDWLMYQHEPPVDFQRRSSPGSDEVNPLSALLESGCPHSLRRSRE